MIIEKSNSGQPIKWSPDDEQLAQRAVEDIVAEEGVGALDELTEHCDQYGGYDYLPRELYDAVRERYQTLHVNEYGSESPFSDSGA